MTMAFKILAQKYPIKAFFGPKFPFFFFLRNFASRQIRGGGFRIQQ